MTLFISPKSFSDTCDHAEFIKFKYKLNVNIQDIDLFTSQLEKYSTLLEVSTKANSCY